MGALLKGGSVPEQAVLLAAEHGRICLSSAVLLEVEDVFSRPKLTRLVQPGRSEAMMAMLLGNPLNVEPSDSVADCRDPKDNKYLELALAAGAAIIVSSDADLLVLHPWRGIDILTPAEFVARFT